MAGGEGGAAKGPCLNVPFNLSVINFLKEFEPGFEMQCFASNFGTEKEANFVLCLITLSQIKYSRVE